MRWSWTGTTKKQNVRRKRRKKDRAIAAIDDWMEEIADAKDGPFGSEGERLKFYFERQQKMHREWARPRTCMFPGCTDDSIPRSHTLPRSGPLSLVAEDGHVITPRFAKNNLVFTRIGIGEASTVPGFCRTHEREFGAIDESKDVNNDRQWVLQFFRTVCWELRILEHVFARMKTLSDDYESMLRLHAAQTLKARLGEEVKVERVTGVDDRQVVATRELARLDELRRQYTAEFFDPLCDAVRGESPPLAMLILDVGESLPVCLAGRGNFHCDTPNGAVDVPVFLQVFPSVNSAKIALLAGANRDDHLKAYVGAFINEPFGILNMVESWMLHGTDHWFLRPSVWTSIQAERRDRIEAVFRDPRNSIGVQATETIFDQVRAEALAREAAGGDETIGKVDD